MAISSISGISLKSVFTSRRARQAGVLYAAMVMSLILGIGVSVLNTRLLGPKAFGDFKLLQTIWTVGVLFITFGFFTTGGNLLAAKQTRKTERQLFGSLLVIAVLISLGFIIVMAIASFLFGHLYGKEIGSKIRLYAGLLFVFPFQVYLREALRGANAIYILAALNVLPQVSYLASAWGVYYRYGFSLDIAILLYLLSIAATVFLVALCTKPNFSHIWDGIRLVLKNNLAVGIHIYIATLVTTTTAYLGQFTIGYFQDTRMVGEFALALTITMPLTMIPNVIATTFFKHFASADRIPSKVIAAAGGLSVVTLAGYLALIKPLVLFLYTERYAGVVPLVYICAMSSVIHGLGDLFNRYLLAHGKTSLLRHVALNLCVVSTVGYISLVAWKGTLGAAITKFIVGLLYLLAMLFYYKHMVKSGLDHAQDV